MNRPRTIAFYVVFAAVLRADSCLFVVGSHLAVISADYLDLSRHKPGGRSLVGLDRRQKKGYLADTDGRIGARGLTIWGTVVPMKQSVATLLEKLPAYWERLQKPLIKMEQQAVISEEKLQEEVSAEIERDATAEGGAVKTSERVTPKKKAVNSLAPSNGEGSLRSSLIGMIESVFGQIKGVALNTTQIFIVLVTVFFGVTFTLMNPRPIFSALFSLVPEIHHATTLVILQRIARFVPRWALSVLFSMLTIGSLFFLLMWPIFDSPTR